MVALGGVGLSGFVLSLRQPSSDPPAADPVATTPERYNEIDDSPNNENDPKADKPGGNDTSVHYTAAYAPNNSSTTKVITTIRKIISGNDKGGSGNGSENEPEPLYPAGRYRNLVFDEITATKDITYKSTYHTKFESGEDGNLSLVDNTEEPKDLKINIYRPSGDTMSKRPLIIFVYGGGWIIGDRYQQESAAIDFAKRGYVTATIDYTMLPPDNSENPVLNPDDSPALDVYANLYNQSARDIYIAYQYLASHKDTYKIDTTKVGLAGWSAGGQISSVLTHLEPLPIIPGLKAVLGSSSILSKDLLSFEQFTGYKSFSSSYSPVSMFASYEDDTGYAGTPNDHVADCEYLDSIGHTCLPVSYSGSGHDLYFDESPLQEDAIDFLATYITGY